MFSTMASWNHGGGTVILVKDNLAISRSLINSPSNIEKCFEFCSVFINSFNTHVVAVYRSPSGNFDTFLESVVNILSDMNHSAELIFVGDFNIKFNTAHHETKIFVIL
nr:unnamed protein product [Callosobruchus analis]